VLERPAIVEPVAVLAAGAVIRQLIEGGSVAPLSALIASNSNKRHFICPLERYSDLNFIAGHRLGSLSCFIPSRCRTHWISATILDRSCHSQWSAFLPSFATYVPPVVSKL